jgi:hypothetical protein
MRTILFVVTILILLSSCRTYSEIRNEDDRVICKKRTNYKDSSQTYYSFEKQRTYVAGSDSVFIKTYLARYNPLQRLWTFKAWSYHTNGKVASFTIREESTAKCTTYNKDKPKTVLSKKWNEKGKLIEFQKLNRKTNRLETNLKAPNKT